MIKSDFVPDILDPRRLQSAGGKPGKRFARDKPDQEGEQFPVSE